MGSLSSPNQTKPFWIRTWITTYVLGKVFYLEGLRNCIVKATINQAIKKLSELFASFVAVWCMMKVMISLRLILRSSLELTRLYSTLCLLGYIACYFIYILVRWIFSKSTISKNVFQECIQSVKQFGSRSNLNWPKHFAKVIISRH